MCCIAGQKKPKCVVVSTNAVVGNVEVVSRNNKQIDKPTVVHAYNMYTN
jgi:hypothetical protein